MPFQITDDCCLFSWLLPIGFQIQFVHRAIEHGIFLIHSLSGRNRRVRGKREVRSRSFSRRIPTDPGNLILFRIRQSDPIESKIRNALPHHDRIRFHTQAFCQTCLRSLSGQIIFIHSRLSLVKQSLPMFPIFFFADWSNRLRTVVLCSSSFNSVLTKWVWKFDKTPPSAMSELI